MALIPCVRCRQPFYASCHDGTCLDALCAFCEYDEFLDGGGGLAPFPRPLTEERQRDISVRRAIKTMRTQRA